MKLTFQYCLDKYEDRSNKKSSKNQILASLSLE
jgi:hypothetical protein